VDETDVPSFLDKWLDLALANHSYIYGDFTICPLEPDIPGHLRRVSVAGAERLVVQNLADSKAGFPAPIHVASKRAIADQFASGFPAQSITGTSIGALVASNLNPSCVGSR